jgi:dTDP-D-glucose 4,6-dehydratase
MRINIFGNFKIAENFWMESSNVFKKNLNEVRCHYISSDTVYWKSNEEGLHMR